MIRVGSIVIRVDDLERQARSGRRPSTTSAAKGDDDDFALLRPRSGTGPNVSLDRVRSSLTIPPGSTSTCTPRTRPSRSLACVGLGATEVHWDKRPADADYVILADPEGNRFCVIDAGEAASG